MEITAFSKGVQVAPRKVRLVASSISKQKPNDALSSLSVIKKRASYVLEKTLRSAIANAINRNLDKNNLVIKRIDVSEGPSYKRFHPSTRGRVHPYKKRTSHIRIVLTDEVQSSKQVEEKVQEERTTKGGVRLPEQA